MGKDAVEAPAQESRVEEAEEPVGPILVASVSISESWPVLPCSVISIIMVRILSAVFVEV